MQQFSPSGVPTYTAGDHQALSTPPTPSHSAVAAADPVPESPPSITTQQAPAPTFQQPPENFGNQQYGVNPSMQLHTRHGHGSSGTHVSSPYKVEPPDFGGQPDSRDHEHHGHSHHHGHAHSTASWDPEAGSLSGSSISAKKILKTILADHDHTVILVFLSLRLFFAFFALVFSAISECLGLSAIAFHTLFDCVGVGVTLIGGAWKSSSSHSDLDEFSNGYSRFPILSAFASSVFVIFVSLNVIKEAVSHYSSPPHVGTISAFIFSIFAFILNVAGVFIFQRHQPLNRRITRGRIGPLLVYQILKDNITVFGVFVSTTLVTMGYPEADALVSGVVACIVIYNALPGVTATAALLLLTTPPSISDTLFKCVGEVSTLDGVLEVRDEHFWSVSPGKVVGTMHVRIRSDANDESVLNDVKNIFSPYVPDLTVQVERDDWALQAKRHLQS